MVPGKVGQRQVRSHGLADRIREMAARQYHLGGLDNLGGRLDRHLPQNTMSSQQTVDGCVMSLTLITCRGNSQTTNIWRVISDKCD